MQDQLTVLTTADGKRLAKVVTRDADGYHVEGYKAMAVAADINDATARAALRDVRNGKAWHGVALRDGELVSVALKRVPSGERLARNDYDSA